MIELFEINLHSTIEKGKINSFLYSYFKIPLDKIGSDDVFFESIGTDNELVIGYTVYYSSEGYETFINFHYNGKYSDLFFLELCIQMTKDFDTEVAIGDLTDDSDFATGKYLVIYPDGTYQKAYEEENGDIFEVKPYTQKSDISELIEIIKKMEP